MELRNRRLPTPLSTTMNNNITNSMHGPNAFINSSMLSSTQGTLTNIVHRVPVAQIKVYRILTT